MNKIMLRHVFGFYSTLRHLSGFLVLSLGLGTLPGTASAAGDPTRPPQGRQASPTEVTQKSGLILQGIIHAQPVRVIINGTIIRLGEKRRGIRVIKIENKRALIRTGGEKRWLHWQPRNLKRPSTQGPSK